MRSVLDHFYDPYLALKEAYRVLKIDGTLLIGLTVRGGYSSLRINNKQENNVEFVSVISKIRRKFKKEGLIELIRVAIKSLMREKKNDKENNITDDHMFYWTYKDLIDLLRTTGFKIVKEHWQKPPFTMCIYLSAKKT